MLFQNFAEYMVSDVFWCTRNKLLDICAGQSLVVDQAMLGAQLCSQNLFFLGGGLLRLPCELVFQVEIENVEPKTSCLRTRLNALRT